MSDNITTEDLQKLDLLLIGKTGQGKSALGNSILERRAFNCSSKSTSATSTIVKDFTQRDNCRISVVDGPGLEDTNLEKVEDREKACKNMTEVMSRCPNGLSAFLFVTRFGQRYTEEDRNALNSLKKIFGQDFMKDFGIVVLTHGNDFAYSMEEKKTPGLSFLDFCKQEEGDLGTLFEDCKFRCVLLDNRDKDEGLKQQQVRKLIQFAKNIRREKGQYSNAHFKVCADERRKMLVELKAPAQNEEFQEQFGFIADAIHRIHKSTSFVEQSNEAGQCQARLEELLKLIQKEDAKTGVHKDFEKRVTEQLNTIKDLQKSIADKDRSKIEAYVSALEKENYALRKSNQDSWKWGALVGALGVGAGVATVASGGALAPVIAVMCGTAGFVAGSATRAIAP